MATIVAVLKDGQSRREFDKPQLLEWLQTEMARARGKLEAKPFADQITGLHARHAACKALHAQLSPLTDKNIDEAAAAGKWRDQPFPLDLGKRLAELADEHRLG